MREILQTIRNRLQYVAYKQQHEAHSEKHIENKKKNLGRPQKLRGGSILQIHVCNLKDETCLANAWQVQDLSEGKVTWGTALRQFQLLDPHEPRTLRCPTKLPCLHMHTVVRMA